MRASLSTSSIFVYLFSAALKLPSDESHTLPNDCPLQKSIRSESFSRWYPTIGLPSRNHTGWRCQTFDVGIREDVFYLLSKSFTDGSIAWGEERLIVEDIRRGSHRFVLYFRHLACVYPEPFPDMSIEILEVATIHEAMIICFDCFLSTCLDSLIEEIIDRFSWLEL